MYHRWLAAAMENPGLDHPDKVNKYPSSFHSLHIGREVKVTRLVMAIVLGFV